MREPVAQGPGGTLGVLDESTLACPDFGGSHAETIAHLRENGRTLSTFSQLPSAAQVRGRLWTPFHDPKCSGRSIHGVPVRYLNAIASSTCR